MQMYGNKFKRTKQSFVFLKKLTISNSEYCIYKKIGCIRTICLQSDTPYLVFY